MNRPPPSSTLFPPPPLFRSGAAPPWRKNTPAVGSPPPRPPARAAVLRILIADDHEVLRRGLRWTLEQRPGWTVCGEAADGREAVALAASLRPDVVVLDVGMPGLNGLEALRRIRKASPGTEILVFTVHEADGMVGELLAAGDRKSTRLNSSHANISYAVFCLKKKTVI